MPNQYKRLPMPKRLLNFFPSLIFFSTLLLATGSAYGQTTQSATLRGTVKDPSGAVISNASVSVISERTKSERKVKTNDEGGYVFNALTPDTYTLKVEIQGFKTSQQTGISLAASDTRGVDITLEVGGADQVVTITGAPEPIQKETGAKENTITAKQIDNLSIIGRSGLELLRILPGVTAPNADEAGQQSVSFGGGTNANSQYHVNGLRGEYNNVSIDGSRVIDIGSNNGTIITANVDMVQEVKIQSSNYAAEHGSSGVQISATTKGGGQDFHGTLYSYFRDAVLNANDRSNTINGVARPEESYRYPGGNVGGPVWIPGTGFNKKRDQLFFFYGLEIQRQQVDPGSRFDVVPTAEMRNGIFPKGSPGFPDGGNVANRIDPIGRTFINFYPLPNFTDPNGGPNNYVATGLQPINRNQQNLRVDYSVSQNTKLFVRWAREAESNDFARGLWWNPSAYELPSHVRGTNLGRSIVTNLTSVINPTMTNEVVFSFSKLLLDNDYADPSKVSLAALGIANFKGPFGQVSKYAPLAFITSWSGQTYGDFWEPGGLPLFAHNSSLSFNDTLAKISGTHTLKFGALVERGNKIQNFNNDPETRLIYAPWGANSTGNVFADMLVGRPAQVVASTQTATGNFRFWNYEFFAQDGWKVRPNFTLEYGLRVAFYPTNRELGGLGVRFDKSAYMASEGVLINGDPNRPNGILQAKRGEIPLGVTANPRPQFAPRLNFAWDLNGKGDTVIRGGAGLFYNRVQGNYQYYSLNQPPNTYGATFDGYGFTGLNNGEGLTYNTLSLINPFTQIGTIGISSADVNSINIPRIANMSLSVAHRLLWNNVLEVSYVGTQGRHLPGNIETNFVPVGKLLSGRVGNADLSVPVQRVAVAGQAGVMAQFRPFPAYSSVRLYQYTGTSSYHSLQATLSHQTNSRLQYFMTYTFSKALGTTQVNETDGNGTDPVDTRNRNWGVLPYDRTHVFNMTYNYLVPDGARSGFKNWLTTGLLNGWQMSGITTFSSGLPIKLKFGGDLAGSGVAAAWVGTDASGQAGSSSGAIAPILARHPQTSGGTQLRERFLDINAISIPSFGQSGAYVSPFYIRAPHRWNHDVSVFKNFIISERQKIQFRAGFFNLFNQAYPNIANGDIDVRLDTVCLVRRDNVPNGAGGTSNNVCDPTGGFRFTDKTRFPNDATDTVRDFGKITNKHGHRIIEFALKYYF
ncbi:MAG: carboxypeptidase regulatory-like domain-containing protein [Acidobacteria bacterium]|nr:carboxypeptidase regulatory-like domain-containing protein [Acidobacteriota bacterium]